MKLLINGYTITEKLELRRKQVEIEEFKTLDKFIGHIKRNKRCYIRLVTLLALLIPSTTLQVFANDSIIGVGLEIYRYLKSACYVICLLGAATEGIKCVVSGTVDQLGKVAVKYISFGLMIKFLPKAIDLIFTLGGN
ncbi:hypothetical protein [Romboutsia sp. 1001285H_161024_C4]|uniref:hypothetical protein n=1 Tax=Romboutsia sp. 1001285H_161024_C4 TaxID=2787109 RepID=UPI00189A94F9|nr:hypothetical protein [Romboutsia sp. 1001285H_161024_C4]